MTLTNLSISKNSNNSLGKFSSNVDNSVSKYASKACLLLSTYSGWRNPKYFFGGIREWSIPWLFTSCTQQKYYQKWKVTYNRRVLGLLISFQPELGNLIYIWFSFIVYARNDTLWLLMIITGNIFEKKNYQDPISCHVGNIWSAVFQNFVIFKVVLWFWLFFNNFLCLIENIFCCCNSLLRLKA